MMQSMRLIALAVLVMLTALPVRALAEESARYDMEEAVATALQNNPQLQSAMSAVEAAEYSRKSAWGVFAPALSSTGTYTFYDHKQTLKNAPTRDRHLYKVTMAVTQNIFDGFSNIATYDREELYKASAEQSVTAQELDLILSVQQGFLGLLKARESVRSAEDSRTRLVSQLKVTQAFYDVGLQPRLDVLQAEVNLAEAENTLLKAQNSVAVQNARMNTLLVLPLENEINYVGKLAEVPFSQTLGQCLEKAFTARPDIAIAKTAVDIAKKSADISKSGLYPSLTGSFNWDRAGDDPSLNGYDKTSTGFSSWNAQLGASWTMFDWGRTYYGWKKSEAGVRGTMFYLEALQQDVLYDVKSKHLSILSAAKRIKVARKALESAQESYRMAVARYQAQVGTNTDVLDAQSSLTDAEASLTEALADYQLALADLYASIGEKNPSLTP